MTTSTMPKHLTEPDVRKALEQAVEEYGPDWVDPNAEHGACQNVYTDPDNNEIRMCIAAKALNILGVPQDWLKTSYGTAHDDVNALWDEGVTHDPATRELLEKAQSAQDDGQPWGECIPTYDEVMDNL